MQDVIASPLPGMWVVELAPRLDPRGSFTRLFSKDVLEQVGIDARLEQINVAHSLRRGTLRGLHWQVEPAAETKIVACLSGALHDVVLDLRPDSPSFGRHAAIRMSAVLPCAVVIPPGCAHGYLTDADDTSILYMTTGRHAPEHERAVRWNDPAFAIPWPFEPVVLSDRDRMIPDCDRLELMVPCGS